jgi:hypothetical protein
MFAGPTTTMGRRPGWSLVGAMSEDSISKGSRSWKYHDWTSGYRLMREL